MEDDLIPIEDLEPLWADFSYQEHQISGIEWMLEREKDTETKGGILCDEMGLGKTIEVLGLMKNSDVLTTLLIAPLATLSQWEEKSISAGFRVLRPSTFIPWETVNKDQLNNPKCMYICNYEKIIWRPSLLNEVPQWGRVVFDEAHRLRNKNRGWDAANAIKTNIHWFLTATPIVNSVDDVRHLFMLTKMKHVPTNLESMETLIGQKVLARKMETVREYVKDIPAQAEIYHHRLEFATEEEQEFYRGIQGAIMKRWKSLESDGNLTGQHRFKLIMRLRQISIHPQVYIASRKKIFKRYSRDDWTDPSTKFTHLRELMTKEKEKTHRWMIFCHFHQEMEILQTFLQELDFVRRVQVYSGGISESMRTQIIETSKEELPPGKHEVLLIQLQAGGVGLNLQHFDRVCFMGPWWNAAIMDQAVGRAVRIGQKNQVVVHHIRLLEEEKIMDENVIINIDDLMMDKVESKRILCNEFLAKAETEV
jgi:SNF2 family DNA or RNA helicase